MAKAPDWKFIYADIKTIAVVGCSRHSGKAARYVPAYMRGHGYDVVPVNPSRGRTASRFRAYPNLLAIPPEVRVEAVAVFRPSAEVPEVARQAAQMAAKPRYFSIPEGISSANASRIAEASGMIVIEDTCMMKTHKRHIRPAH